MFEWTIDTEDRVQPYDLVQERDRWSSVLAYAQF